MFEAQIQSIHRYIEEIGFEEEPVNLRSPIHYILQLGGKRVRPLLTLLSYQLYKNDFDRVLPQAVAIELFHNFTLMHDDIMDDAPLRRGKCTVHAKYDTNTAILSGDAMLIMAYDHLIKNLTPGKAVKCQKVFSDVAMKICEGQQYDMDFETRDEVSIDEYLKMIRLKTAVLLGASMSIGGIVGGASDVAIRHLYECGVNLGLAFQIKDDYLDVFGDSKKTGKQKGGDIIRGKKTILYLKALEIGGPRVQDQLIQLWNADHDRTADVPGVIQLYQSLNVSGHCESLQASFFARGMNHLKKIRVDHTLKEPLQQLFEQLLVRES